MIEIPRLPSTNHPSVTTEVGRFRLVCQRGARPTGPGAKWVEIRFFEYTRDSSGLYERGVHNWPRAKGWPLHVRRLHYKQVMEQLIPLLMLDALPDKWAPVIPPHPRVPSRNPNRRK